HMDFVRPVEAVVPGVQGRVLGALARVEVGLPLSTLARVAGVSRARTTQVVDQLAALGIVTRQGAGRAVLVRLERDNVAGRAVQDLAGLEAIVLRRLRLLARSIRPAPVTLAVFGSFARGEATADSDLDLLAGRPFGADNSDEWTNSVGRFTRRASVLTGNPANVLEYSESEIRERLADANADSPGAELWRSILADAVELAGVPLHKLVNDSAR
ncbi:MAG: MarR family transcriptional regulator, partial [Acidimicrobiales bacterium]